MASQQFTIPRLLISVTWFAACLVFWKCIASADWECFEEQRSILFFSAAVATIGGAWGVLFGHARSWLLLIMACLGLVIGCLIAFG